MHSSQSGDMKFGEPPANKLLAALPKASFEQLLPELEQIDLIFGDVIFNVGDEIRDVYFPNSGVVSLFAVENQATLEIALVGNEGVVGLPIFLETGVSPNLAVVQGNGTAFKIKSRSFLEKFRQNAFSSQLVHRYTYFLLAQISQAVVCNRLHLTEARLACLLLMMHDRMMTNQFQLKQEFISKVLGVRREAVTKAASRLQRQELISYSRGSLLIINREGLENVCCRCYKIVTAEYHDLLANHKLTQ
jgi:CRP-like cAMP-binding protein